MFCPECGSNIEDGSVFCPECGNKIDSSQDTTEIISNSSETVVAETVTEVIPPAVGMDQTKAMPQVEEQVQQAAVYSAPAPAPAKSQGIDKKMLIIIIAAVVVVIAAIVTIVVVLNQPQASSNTNSTTTSSQVAEDSSSSSKAEKEETKAPVQEEVVEYILPNSNTTYLTEADLAGLSDWELYLARNEIFARLGRQFKNADLQNYLGSKSWYHGTYSPEAFDSHGPKLNDYEKKNSELIMSIEKRHNSPYLN